MKEKFTFTKDGLFRFICCIILPVIAIGGGIVTLSKSVTTNLGFVMAFFIIPLITVCLFACCIFSNCKSRKKDLLCCVILILLFMSFCFFSLISGYTQVKSYNGDEARQQYAFVKGEKALLPELSDIGHPQNVEHYNVYTCLSIFASEADYLICRYTPEEFEFQKERLEEEYVFQADIITDEDANCEPITEIDGYQFRLLSIEEYKEELYYPKDIVLIGYSDDAQEIVYLAFHDMDLDYIPSLKSFIIDDCGWNHVR